MATAKISEDILQTWLDFKEDQTDQSLRNRLIERYFPLVKYNAERVWAKLPEGVDLNDLISAGVFGLMDAIEAFDLERGVKFETYCVPRIRGAMLDELRTMDWVPRLVRSKASKLEAARKKVEAEVGRPPKDEEIAAKIIFPEKFSLSLKDAVGSIYPEAVFKKRGGGSDACPKGHFGPKLPPTEVRHPLRSEWPRQPPSSLPGPRSSPSTWSRFSTPPRRSTPAGA